MGDIIVKYNNNQITPTPLVSRSYQFIDYGVRFGQTEQIDLTCYLTGIEESYKTSINNLNSTFSGQFKTLEVSEQGGSTVYKWDNVVLQEISVKSNSFAPGSFTPYNVKLLAYQIPSGVTEPTNEYSFSQSDDGMVTVNHKISAKGVRTSNSPLDNAISFVNTFKGKNPYSNCAPLFIPNSSGILMSTSESIDRINGSYTINEIYRYITGQSSGYILISNLNINESPSNEYVTMDLDVNIEGSPVDKNLSQIKTAAQNLNLFNILQNEYGLSTSNIHRDNYSITQESGKVKVNVKCSFISGVSSDISGYFDYAVSLDRDVVTNQSTWKIDGEYLTRGPLSLKKSQLSSFKSAQQASNFIPYLSGLITNSPLFTGYGSGRALNAIQVSNTEDTGRAILRLSASFSDYDAYKNFVQPKYSIEVEPSKWIYEMLPSANIEGHYVTQDLQMRNQAKIKLSFASIITGEYSGYYTDISSILTTLSGIYVSGNSFLVSENLNSGISNISLDKDYIGKDSVSDTLSLTKIHGNIGNGYVRKAGFKFGY